MLQRIGIRNEESYSEVHIKGGSQTCQEKDARVVQNQFHFYWTEYFSTSKELEYILCFFFCFFLSIFLNNMNFADTFNLLLQGFFGLQPSLRDKKETEINSVRWKSRPERKHPHKCPPLCGLCLNSSHQGQHVKVWNVEQMKSELTGECVLAVMEAMAVLESLICRLKSCLSSRPRWLNTWSNRTAPSSCF